MDKQLKTETIYTDVLIIGAGTAGCYAAYILAENSDLKVMVAEKAHIKRSGCLAAGVNAINAYITKGHTPEDYVEYAKKDAENIVRTDLLQSAAENFNEAAQTLEKFGLVILKDENGEYVSRGWRNIKINGENIKPLLAKAVGSRKNIQVSNRLNITDLLVENNQAAGAVGFQVDQKKAVIIKARAVLIATGGASGIYKPNHPGFSRHKMWYPPFNTGAGYAMGLKAGAEMTSFEMRFIALRCKDTIAPVGTIAQGIQAEAVNRKGEFYENRYGLTTSERVYGTVAENLNGNGPCFLKTSGISKEQNDELLKAYLNMAPAQTLKWIENDQEPMNQDVEIEGTEPYIVGGHTASGFWVDTNRQTTIKNLYAAGDAAGGCPQKYVTGALAEGKIAALKIMEMLKSTSENQSDKRKSNLENKQKDSSFENFQLENQAERILSDYERYLNHPDNAHSSPFSIEELEEAMQNVMDEYAGGISSHYQYSEASLKKAEEKIEQIEKQTELLNADNMHELLFIYELKERLLVCRALIAHLKERRETRWHSFNENTDYPNKDEKFECYVNSRLEKGKIVTFLRDLVKEKTYEHSY